MLERFRKFIAVNGLAKLGDRILVAVSGGIDSMVMTHLFLQSEFRFAIAHCNFSLRGAESDEDERLVSEFAAEHNIQFYAVRFQTKEYADEKHISIQMAARDLRYEWFEKTRNSLSFDTVAVAHNLNDNIETFLINLIRGTGIAGLSGMKPATRNIIRPLLFATRGEITEYADTHRILFREDQSNADTKYLRNNIRHRIIPLLKEINPSIESTLFETSEILSDTNEIVSAYLDQLREKVSASKNGFISFDINQADQYISNKAVLFGLFRPYGIRDVSLNDLINIISGKTGGQLFTSTHRIIKNRKELIVTKRNENDQRKWLINSPDDFEILPQLVSAAFVKITREFRIPEGPDELCMDADKLSFPMIIRNWKTGDFFYPLGLTHKKKLSDYFTDNKYSILDKDNSLIMESGGKIVCILGDRIDNRFRITARSRNALIIRIKPVT